MKNIILGTLLLLSLTPLQAQVSNDVCLFATPIISSDQYCSGSTEFTNIGAEQDPDVITNSCFLNFTSAVWFSFVPKEPAVVIRITGTDGGGSLVNPQIGIFEGTCGDLVQVGCSTVSTGQGVNEVVVGDLVIGQVYYIMVDGFNGSMGTFQLCVNDFIPIPAPQADCDLGVLLCDKSSFQVESLVGNGLNDNEVSSSSCIGQEFASSWYKWTCDESGPLTFVITPNNNNPAFVTDDIDFAVYKLPGGLDDCNNKELVRCMASGASQGTPYSSWAICNGVTGLSETSSDTNEDPGCSDNSDNFVDALYMISGESYVLMINNFSQSGLGFSIDFGGTGTFLGPNVDFAVDAIAKFECDKTITFTDSSYTGIGDIVSWKWNFGVGSTPVSETSSGPHDVIYESFGNKVAALTIEGEGGCLVTKVVEFYVEPCCDDFSDLDLEATWVNNLCFGDAEGVILAEGVEGNPLYSYSIDGVNYSPNPQFPSLVEGGYLIYVQDIKGCVDSIVVNLVDPLPIDVSAGPDITVQLGDSAVIDGSYTSIFGVDWEWFGNLDWLDCPTCLTPTGRPFMSTEYTLVVTDVNGCTSSDLMVFYVELVRPLYAPNVFTPNDDGTNDFFNLFSTHAAVETIRLSVYNRWGNLVYDGAHLPLNDLYRGWDGTYQGKDVNPGVFAWVAEVLYLDGVSIVFKGDVTVVK